MDIFVKGLPLDVTSSQLEQLFSTYGKVLSAKIIVDRETKLSRGFGFVTMLVESEGKLAIRRINGSELDGKRLTAKPARPKDENPKSFKPSYNSVLPKSFNPPKGLVKRTPFKDYD